tara:strand:+ start:4974 stop:5153 length:180 start_codon:yes stop_codon:yes gene_type:complete
LFKKKAYEKGVINIKNTVTLLKLNLPRYFINSAKDKTVEDINKKELSETKFMLNSFETI